MSLRRNVLRIDAMLARVQETAEGLVIVIPPEYVKAWRLRQDSLLEVHRLGSTHERDEPVAVATAEGKARPAPDVALARHVAAFRASTKAQRRGRPLDEA